MVDLTLPNTIHVTASAPRPGEQRGRLPNGHHANHPSGYLTGICSFDGEDGARFWAWHWTADEPLPVAGRTHIGRVMGGQTAAWLCGGMRAMVSELLAEMTKQARMHTGYPRMAALGRASA